MNKIYEKVLADYKKANKESKQRMIEKYGFSTERELFKFMGYTPQKPAKIVVKKPVVHLVDILDASTSMSGAKISGANTAIREGIAEFKKETKVEYKYTQVSFSSSGDIQTHDFMMPISSVNHKNIPVRNMTALYEAVGETLLRLKSAITPGDKVLVKIYTDGEENNSNYLWHDGKKLSALVTELEDLGFTITFIGTDKDVKSMVKNINIKISNTWGYNGTAEGLKQSMDFANTQTASYSSNVSRGIDVKENFFTKKVGKL